jgi:protocatechuate 3,4-dioxygenase beta subunit
MRKSLFAFGFALIILTRGLAIADERATATGKVTDATGNAIDRATVFVYEGHVKKGYGVYCPTCWADCGKHATTDAEGNFTIAGLNPDLIFKLMVVKEGYTAAFIDKMDPAKGPAEVATLKPRPPIQDTSQVVRGLVVDGHGKPVKDAVVEQEGVAFHDHPRRVRALLVTYPV